MASAKQTAMNYLGNEDDYINLSGLNTERQNANDVYKTNTTSFQNAYNDLLSTIANNRNKAKTDFGSGRATVNENAFLQNRSDVANLASRGLSGGIAQLSKLGNRMETGRQYSDLANTYYNTLNIFHFSSLILLALLCFRMYSHIRYTFEIRLLEFVTHFYSLPLI